MTWVWLVLTALAAAGIFIAVRARANTTALRALHRSRARIDRFTLAKKSFIRASLLDDPAIARAVDEHSRESNVPQAETWRRVETYIDEIVPFFNILTYYKIGLA
ncbi:MAG: hypothetical protein ACJ79X_09490, partial [Gemmatimonadaceae bacterium]